MSTHRTSPNRLPSLTGRGIMIGASALSTLLLIALPANPAIAQATQQVRVTGHVAPRCWTLLPNMRSAELLAASPHSRRSVAARCNHAATPISMRVRRLSSTIQSTAAPDLQRADASADETPGNRTAIEIVLSPTL